MALYPLDYVLSVLSYHKLNSLSKLHPVLLVFPSTLLKEFIINDVLHLNKGLTVNCVVWPELSLFRPLSPVVRRPISANPGLNFNPGLFFFSSKAFSRTIFSILFRVANHQIVDKKNYDEFAF